MEITFFGALLGVWAYYMFNPETCGLFEALYLLFYSSFLVFLLSRVSKQQKPRDRWIHNGVCLGTALLLSPSFKGFFEASGKEVVGDIGSLKFWFLVMVVAAFVLITEAQKIQRTD